MFSPERVRVGGSVWFPYEDDSCLLQGWDTAAMIV